MKLKFLGTAAAEGFPSLYCKCDACVEAINNGGRNIRTRAQALLDDKVLIDFGPDTYHHMITYNVPTDKIHHVLITHSHGDHFYKNDLIYRRKGYASKVEEEPLYVHATNRAYNKVVEMINEEQMGQYLQAHEVVAYEPFDILNYHIYPLKANHSEYSNPVIYLISDESKTMLYAHDTGVFYEKVWEELSKLEKPLDLITLDCTAGILKGWRDGHLSFDTFLEMINKMRELKIIDENTKVIANHFSHNGLATYDKMAEVAAAYNVIVSYDGMEVEF